MRPVFVAQYFGQKEPIDRARVKEIYEELCESFDMDRVYNHRHGAKAWFFFDIAEDFAYVLPSDSFYLINNL